MKSYTERTKRVCRRHVLEETSHYELSNHLGNVLAVVSDMKLGYLTAIGQTRAQGYKAQVQSASDYFPFGWTMPSRSFNSSNYRHGFNGKENDHHWAGQLIQDYGFRLYNPAIGKFLSVDPLAPEYPELTPYQFSHNRPIEFIDLDGLEGTRYDETWSDPGIVNAMNKGKVTESQVKEHYQKPMGVVGAPVIVVMASGTVLGTMGASSVVTFIANEIKDEALSSLTGGMSDYLDMTKGLKNIIEGGKDYLGNKLNKEFRKDNGISPLLQSLEAAKDITARKKRLEKFADPDGGYLAPIEAEGLAIFERAIGKNVSPSLEKGVDAMLGNRRVSHFGTGPIGKIKYDDKSFNRWLNGTFKSHFRDKSIDNFIIDLRNFNQEQKNTVLNEIKAMGADVAKKVHTIL